MDIFHLIRMFQSLGLTDEQINSMELTAFYLELLERLQPIKKQILLEMLKEKGIKIKSQEGPEVSQ